MARGKTTVLTQRESEIMAVLWELKTATSEEIRVRLRGSPHDSSVRTMLRVLIGKGHVLTEDGTRPAIYRPASPKGSLQKTAILDLLKRFFAGSAEDLVLHLLDDEKLTAEQLKKIQVAYRRSKKGDPS